MFCASMHIWLVCLLVVAASVVQAIDNDDFVITESEDVTETEAAAPVLLEREEIQKMKIKQLKAMLEERGQECKGCLDKTDYVERVFEVQDLPIVKKPNIELPKSTDSKISQDELDELMTKMRANGFGNAKMFNANDLKGMNMEDLDPSSFSTAGGHDFSGARKKSKRNWRSPSGGKKRSKKASEL